MLDINSLSFSYGNKKILNGVSFSLKKGEIGTLIGASGSGKSTLFKLVTGMLPSQKGAITVSEESLPASQQQIAYMTQEDLLLPWRTILSNLTLLGELGKPSNSHAALKEEALKLLANVGLSGWEKAFPRELSGGMRQRASLARALLLKRPLLLLDEPFGSLDVGNREHMYALLREMQMRFNTTILMVTHDFRDALTLSDHIFLLSEGRIKKKWTVEDRQNPLAAAKLSDEIRKQMISNFL